MNFKRYYTNGNGFSLYLSYRRKNYKISIEEIWNDLMYELTLFTNRRFVIEKEDDYFVIYMRYFFKKEFIEKFSTKEEAQEKIKEMKKGILS
jgi:hypothetical protein